VANATELSAFGKAGTQRQYAHDLADAIYNQKTTQAGALKAYTISEATSMNMRAKANADLWYSYESSVVNAQATHSIAVSNAIKDADLAINDAALIYETAFKMTVPDSANPNPTTPLDAEMVETLLDHTTFPYTHVGTHYWAKSKEPLHDPNKMLHHTAADAYHQQETSTISADEALSQATTLARKEYLTDSHAEEKIHGDANADAAETREKPMPLPTISHNSPPGTLLFPHPGRSIRSIWLLQNSLTSLQHSARKSPIPVLSPRPRKTTLMPWPTPIIPMQPRAPMRNIIVLSN